MAIAIQQQSELPVKFRLGATYLDDPAPHAKLIKKHELLVRQYPQFRFTTIFESDAVIEPYEGSDHLVYRLVVPPPKVNG